MTEKKEEFSEEIKEARKNLSDTIVETKHSMEIDGKKYDYLARVGKIVMKKEEDTKTPQPVSEIFFIAYHLEGVKNQAKRPITFSFNGGPGSSSVWLHLGMIGPKRVISEVREKPVPPPYVMEDNSYTMLDMTDMVFIDPVSTGYSRAAPGEKAENFHTPEKDVESVGDFIRLYTSRFSRWKSPKFLIGESYGTTRAAGLSGYLQERHGMFLNGIMLISSILNFQTARFTTGNDLPYILFLPTYAATAYYHKKLDTKLSLKKFLAEVEEFARAEYSFALMKGDSLTFSEKNTIAKKLHEYTGLSVKYLNDTNLRINIHRFTKELLRSDGRTIGRLDTRYLGYDRDSVGEHYEYDPSYAAILGPYTATFNDYIREDLGYESDQTYEIIANIWESWKYDKQMNEFLDVGETLRKAMSMNAALKIFVANGRFDLATPYFATEYTFKHMFLKPELKKNITMKYYDAGHMMYLNMFSLHKLKKDLKKYFSTAYAGADEK